MSNQISIQLIFKAILPPVAWAAVIFFLSSQPSLPSLELVVSDFFLKKTAHIMAYAVLYVLVWRSIYLLTQRRSAISKTVWLGAFVICILYALTDEWHQSLTPTRSASFRDIGFDATGMLAAFLWKYKYI